MNQVRNVNVHHKSRNSNLTSTIGRQREALWPNEAVGRLAWSNRVISILFSESYLCLNKQSCLGSSCLCQSLYSVTPANQLSVTASGSGNNATFVCPPCVPSSQRTLMKTDRKWGRKARAGNDHI